MKFFDAQEDMNVSYYGGGTGVLASGLVWCVAGIIGLLSSNMTSMLALFFGGMLIFPLGMLLAKALKRSGTHNSENPLGKLAIESTFILFVGLFMAFSVAQLEVSWFYPIMLMIIGVRYLTFQTIYGKRIYWVLGAVLAISGAACIVIGVPFIAGAFIGGVTEILFSIFILNQSQIPA